MTDVNIKRVSLTIADSITAGPVSVSARSVETCDCHYISVVENGSVTGGSISIRAHPIVGQGYTRSIPLEGITLGTDSTTHFEVLGFYDAFEIDFDTALTGTGSISVYCNSTIGGSTDRVYVDFRDNEILAEAKAYANAIAGISDAPNDGNDYGRRNLSWDMLNGKYLLAANNLSDVVAPATALANINGQPASTYLSNMVSTWGSGFGTAGYIKKATGTTFSFLSSIPVSDIAFGGASTQYVDGTGTLTAFSVSTYNMLTPATTKGDLVVMRGSIFGSMRLPIGANGTALLADSTQTLGMRWGSVSASAAWGSISGTIASQADLQSQFAGPQAFANYLTIPAAVAITFTPTVGTWYRVGTFAAANSGQCVDLKIVASYAGCIHYIALRVSKATANSLGTQFRFETLGDYNSGAGFANVRVVDAGTNQPSYVDVQFVSATNTLVYATAVSSDAANAPAFALDSAFTSQGSGALGTSFSAKQLRVDGDTSYGIYSTVTYAGLQTLKMTGSTSQYVRGDGSIATFPAVGSGTVTNVSAGAGMSFTAITGSGSVALGTPSSCSNATGNSASGSSHTHTITGFMPTIGGTFSGAITAPGVTDSSDAKFKRDIRALRGGMDIIRALVPVRFWNTLTETDEVGFVAQETRKPLPEVVVTDDNGDLGLAYGRITSPIVAALQDIDRRLSRLESR